MKPKKKPQKKYKYDLAACLVEAMMDACEYAITAQLPNTYSISSKRLAIARDTQDILSKALKERGL